MSVTTKYQIEEQPDSAQERFHNQNLIKERFWEKKKLEDLRMSIEKNK